MEFILFHLTFIQNSLIRVSLIAIYDYIVNVINFLNYSLSILNLLCELFDDNLGFNISRIHLKKFKIELIFAIEMEMHWVIEITI